jgi:hypothetical protein
VPHAGSLAGITDDSKRFSVDFFQFCESLPTFCGLKFVDLSAKTSVFREVTPLGIYRPFRRFFSFISSKICDVGNMIMWNVTDYVKSHYERHSIVVLGFPVRYN